MVVRWLVGSVVGILIFLNLAFADEVPRFYGEEVVVTASRLPQPRRLSPWSTTTIGRLELLNSKNVSEAVRNVSGVDVISYGGPGSLGSARIRGFNSSQVLVLVDGKRINSPTLGMFDLGDLLTGSIEKIEVVRTPLSALYGSDAVSGAINIITRPVGEDKRMFSVSAGSFGEQKYEMEFGGGNYLIAGKYLKSDGFRQNSDYLAKDLFGKMTFDLPLGKLMMDGCYYDAIKGVPGVPTSDADTASASTPHDRQSDKNYLVGLDFTTDSGNLRVYQNSFDQKADPSTWSGPSSNQAWRTAIEGQQKLGLGMGEMLVGFEAREDKGKTTISGEHAVRNYAAFFQDELSLSERLLLNASIRGDKHSTAGTSFNPRGGLAYKLAQDLSLKISAGSAFRAPTLNELYWNDPAWGMFGNTLLKPEKSFSYEIGLERESKGRRVGLRYYSSSISDMISWVYDTTTFQTLAANIGEVQTEGVEFELEQKLGEKGKGYVNYTYQRAIDKKMAVDKTIPYTPQNKYNAGILFEDAAVLVRNVGTRYIDSQNTISLPGYTVVDLRISRRAGKAVIDFSVNNLFDERYSEAMGLDLSYNLRKYQMPGRSFLLGVKWVI